MVNTISEIPGRKASNIGVPEQVVQQVVFDGTDDTSPPILLDGRKVVSIQSSVAATLNVEAANFSSRTTRDKTDYVSGLLKPAAADFGVLKDKTGTAISLVMLAKEVHAVSELGFPVWLRLVQGAATAGTVHVSSKG